MSTAIPTLPLIWGPCRHGPSRGALETVGGDGGPARQGLLATSWRLGEDTWRQGGHRPQGERTEKVQSGPLGPAGSILLSVSPSVHGSVGPSPLPSSTGRGNVQHWMSTCDHGGGGDAQLQSLCLGWWVPRIPGGAPEHMQSGGHPAHLGPWRWPATPKLVLLYPKEMGPLRPHGVRVCLPGSAFVQVGGPGGNSGGGCRAAGEG